MPVDCGCMTFDGGPCDHDYIQYRQCRLKKGNTEQTSWIPAKFAIVGKVLKLKNPDGTWDDGWAVESASVKMRTALDLHERTYVSYDNVPKRKRKKHGSAR